jgi:hypothetical protein
MVSFRRLLVAALLALAPPAHGQIIGNGVIGMGGGSGVITVDGVAATVDVNCLAGTVNNSGAITAIPATVTTNRTTTPTANQSTMNDVAFNYSLVNDNVYRASSAGCLTEESRQNLIRNNSMQGAVVSTTRTPQPITSLSRSASATANVVNSGTNGLSVNDLVCVTGASVSTYNLCGPVTAVPDGQHFSYLTTVSTTDTATGASYTAQSSGQSNIPTFWFATTMATGDLGIAINSVGTENGIDEIEIHIAGVSNGVINNSFFSFDAASISAAAQGLTYNGSVFIRLVAGSLGTLTGIQHIVQEQGAGCGNTTSLAITPTNAPLGTQRWLNPHTITGAGCTTFLHGLQWQYNTNAVVDFTLRIGWPQFEKDNNNAAFASGSQPIGNNGTSGCVSGTYTVTGGTFGSAATMTGVATGGVITSLTTANAGNYSVFPSAGAGLTGTGCTGSPNISTPLPSTAPQTTTFATSPIRTTNATVTRNEEDPFIAVSGWGNTAITLYWNGLVFGATNFPFNSFSAPIDASTAVDSTTNAIASAAAGGAYNISCFANGFQGTANQTITLNANHKIGCGMPASGISTFYIDGSAGPQVTQTGLNPVASLGLGRHIHFQQPVNQYVKRFAWWNNYQGTAVGMQALTSGPP